MSISTPRSQGFFPKEMPFPFHWGKSPGNEVGQLVSCDWSWRSHGSLISGKFDLKINRSVKTEYSDVACSYSSAPALTLSRQPCKLQNYSNMDEFETTFDQISFIKMFERNKTLNHFSIVFAFILGPQLQM